jgi:DNA repair exonuclease SbcCD nuclease subunit
LKNSNIRICGAEIGKENSNSLYNSLVLNADNFNIVVLHGQESEYQGKDKTEVINLGALKYKGIDYLALGHIHAYKEGSLDARGRYCYSGCLEGRGFDECGKHGFVVLNIDEQKKNFVSEFVPFSYRNIYTKEVDITDCMTTAEILKVVENELDKEAYLDNSLVKVVLVGNTSVECEKNIDYILENIKSRYFFVKIYDHSKITVNYDEYMLDMSLKGEFVRIVKASNELDEDMKAEVIRMGIQALAGEMED